MYTSCTQLHRVSTSDNMWAVLLPLLVSPLPSQGESVIKHAPPAPIPVITHPTTLDHAGHTPVLTDQKCHVEEVELYAEVCTPTIERDCQKIKVKTQAIHAKEDCVKVVRTVCTESEELVDNEVCYYVYNKEKQESEATTVKVEYETKCEEETQKVCPQKQYGHQGYCKTVKNQVCYNVPVVSPDKTSVTVGYPVPEKKCENKQVKLPKVICDEVEEEKCFQLPFTSEETDTLEKCTTELGHPKCEQTPIKLPRQVCVEKKAYHAPALAYHVPAPAYNVPAPAFHAPNPVHLAPVQFAHAAFSG